MGSRCRGKRGGGFLSIEDRLGNMDCFVQVDPTMIRQMGAQETLCLIPLCDRCLHAVESDILLLIRLAIWLSFIVCWLFFKNDFLIMVCLLIFTIIRWKANCLQYFGNE